MEDRIHAIKTERDVSERLVAELKETVSADQIEMARLKALLERERSKVSFVIIAFVRHISLNNGVIEV